MRLLFMRAVMIPRLCLSCPDQDVFDWLMRLPEHAPHVALVPARWINGA